MCSATNTATIDAPVLSSAAPSPLLLDVRAAARLCGVGRTHFLAMHSAGKIPMPVRLGRRVLWRGAELAAWIEAGCPERVRWHTTSRPRQGYGRQEGGRR